MTAICLHDKKTIESYFRRNPGLHLYSIGDLDDLYWPYTTWYALASDNELGAVVLLYTGQPLPVLLALRDEPLILGELLESVKHLLPSRFYSHLSPGLEEIFFPTHELKSHGEHYKMVLKNISIVNNVDCSEVIRLSEKDLKDIHKLYSESYPGNWFDPRMLETNQYFGIRNKSGLICIAGIHVYSEQYRVATLGNITTQPEYRNKGYSSLVTACLCQSLLKKVDDIGLNVKTDNKPAISCYGKLGFENIATYGEFLITKK